MLFMNRLKIVCYYNLEYCKLQVSGADLRGRCMTAALSGTVSPSGRPHITISPAQTGQHIRLCRFRPG